MKWMLCLCHLFYQLNGCPFPSALKRKRLQCWGAVSEDDPEGPFFALSSAMQSTFCCSPLKGQCHTPASASVKKKKRKN